jgi:hypothetical protein
MMLLSIIELKHDAPERLHNLFNRIRSDSVKVMIIRNEQIFIYYEGGIYTRSANRKPSEEETHSYALIAAGRAAMNYPTIAKFSLPSEDGKFLETVGSINIDSRWSAVRRKDAKEQTKEAK